MNKIEFLHRIALNEPNTSISIVCPSLEGLRALWDENISVFILGATRINRLERVWKYPNGSLVAFQHFTEPKDCEGCLRDYLYTYSNIDGRLYDKLVQRTKNMVFLELV